MHFSCGKLRAGIRSIERMQCVLNENSYPHPSELSKEITSLYAESPEFKYTLSENVRSAKVGIILFTLKTPFARAILFSQ